MKNQSNAVKLACLSLVATLALGTARAQTAGDVDLAKLKADLAEAVAREAAAKAKAATDDAKTAAETAAASHASANAAAAALKARSEAEKAALEAQGKANEVLIPKAPDPSRYKVDAPSVVVTATTNRLAHGEIAELASQVSGDVLTALLGSDVASACKSATVKAHLMPATARVRQLLLASDQTSAALTAMAKQLGIATQSLKDAIERASKVAETPTGGSTLSLGPAVIPAITGLGEVVASFAQIFRTRNSLGSVDNKAAMTAVFQAMVKGQLARCGSVHQLEADRMLSLLADSPESKLLSAASAKLGETQEQIRAARVKADDLQLKVAAQKDDADDKTKKHNARILAEVAKLEALHKAIQTKTEELDKALLALQSVDAQGDSPMDLAIRGGQLRAKLKSESTYSLDLELSASNSDVLASDGLLRGLRVTVSSSSIARWQLFNAEGRVVHAGAPLRHSPPLAVQLKSPD